MIIDGYNVIHAWRLDTKNLEDARDKLICILDDYAGYSGEDITIVFDSYKTRDAASETRQGLVTVVFTAYGVTADTHIQRLVKLSETVQKVVTADYLEQLSVFGSGAIRVTPDELRLLIKAERQKNVLMLDKSALSPSELRLRLALDAIRETT
ncbi:MAG: NYN domain-containing protein [Christensenellales bacterium]|jgi:predicted RNA-binding protein with PIN domain